MGEYLTRSIADAITTLLVHLPLAVLIIRLYVWSETAQRILALPSPSWRQTWGIALAIIVLTPA